jgi:hypothetical protein
VYTQVVENESTLQEKRIMPKQKITIEVDVPEGYEATGECRCPCIGEYYLSQDSAILAGFTFSAEKHIILRKKYVWPEWLKGWGFVRLKNRDVVELLIDPGILNCDGWDIKCPRRYVVADTLKLMGVPVPDITEWDRPVLNPNYSPPDA